MVKDDCLRLKNGRWKFFNIIYYNHQEHKYCYLGSQKNTILQQKLMEKITKLKILKENMKDKKIITITIIINTIMK